MKKARNMLLFLLVLLGFTATQVNYDHFDLSQLYEFLNEFDLTSQKKIDISHLSELPDFDGEHYVVVLNENQPAFVEEDLSLSTDSWQTLSDLDYLNRVGRAEALISQRSFPKEPRESLYVSPSGWKQKKIANNNYLYNRSHLIGFQLTGENNNLKNLFTGTNLLNQKYMVIYENEIANYIKESNHHVRYRVTPYFKDQELVARGVQLEAQSVEDLKVRFNVFIYNVQDGYEINYQTGSAKKA